jgi:hypothetical protein
LALIVRLKVGCEEIRTTAEHPFCVRGRGWVPAGMLGPREWLLAGDGTWQVIESVRETGEVTTVYNFEVAGYHTYFVGQESWGFDLWTHNHNRPGRRGSPETRADVDAKRDDILGRNPEFEHTHGGTDAVTGAPKPEMYVPGSGGGPKGSTYPDLSFRKPDGSYHHDNTVDTKAKGEMTRREAENLDRLGRLRPGDTRSHSPKPK